MQKDGKNYMSYRVKENIGIRDYVEEISSALISNAYNIIFHFISDNGYKEKKYRLSICAIFKNEGFYLKEWIEYHLIVGVDHFYLYNNDSTDNYKTILEPYIERGIVDLIEWPYKQGQMSAYEDCISSRKEEANWIGFIDLDEFIVPIKDKSIYDFLFKFRNRPSVVINWKMFGTSGKCDAEIEKLVTERFTHSWEKGCNVGKCFYNTCFEFDFAKNKGNAWMHQMWCRKGSLLLPSVNSFGKTCVKDYQSIPKTERTIQINHYYTKSLEEYLNKSRKGDAFFEKSPKNMGSFYKCEVRCSVNDVSIFKYISLLKYNMTRNAAIKIEYE